MKEFSVLFVCMGNIRRSPTAEAVFRHSLVQNALEDFIEADSAGTEAYHVGDAPDIRARQTALKRGYDMSGIRARQITPSDFKRFDLILAMDNRVLSALLPLCPSEYADRLKPYVTYALKYTVEGVPDPYYGGSGGFERVLDLIEDVTGGLIETLKKRIDRQKNRGAARAPI